MEPLLYLTHRIPFPPNKGDKLRSFHLLRHLSKRYRVHLGTFIDDPADAGHVPALASYCASWHVASIQPRLARLRSLQGLFTGEALTLRYYRDDDLNRWVRRVVREEGIRSAVVFSSAMAQYVDASLGLRVIVDFVDVDSAKWDQYARMHRWPLSHVYDREGSRLLAFERAVANAAHASVFVTRNEADLFRRLAPECAERVYHAGNGVDTTYFDPGLDVPDPYPPGEEPLVYTGAMDYWPNVDAVCWFATDVLPAIVASRPRARFYVVGMNPAPAVQALARDARIVVTGRVADVRPYVRHACAIVAPLRVSRGIQNKVLEAMAMARPVVVSQQAAAGLSGTASLHYEVAADAHDFAQRTLAVMDPSVGQRLGEAARHHIRAQYDWDANLALFDQLLADDAFVPRAAG